MMLPDIRWWNELALEMLETSLSRRISTIEDVHKQLADIAQLPGWEGAAAEAARRRPREPAGEMIHPRS